MALMKKPCTALSIIIMASTFYLFLIMMSVRPCINDGIVAHHLYTELTI